MSELPKNPRNHHRKEFFYGDNGELFVSGSGEMALGLARIYRPSDAAIKKMLLSIRERQGWSQAALSAVLGVPKQTLRRWEDGTRSPSAAGRKLIWFVHALVFEPDSLLGGLDHLITWGQARREEILVMDEPHAGAKRPNPVNQPSSDVERDTPEAPAAPSGRFGRSPRFGD